MQVTSPDGRLQSGENKTVKMMEENIMMENSEKVISKIKKVLELSKNNPSQEEAQAAALKAQKLMVEYHISMNEIEAVEDIDSIVEKSVSVGNGSKWKYVLSQIVAKNFRCKHFYYGKKYCCILRI